MSDRQYAWSVVLIVALMLGILVWDITGAVSGQDRVATTLESPSRFVLTERYEVPSSGVYVRVLRDNVTGQEIACANLAVSAPSCWITGRTNVSTK